MGVLRRKGLRSILRDEWEVLDVNDNVSRTIIRRQHRNGTPAALLFGSWLPQNYDMTFGETRVADLKQNFNLFRYELNLDFSMDMRRLLDRRLGIAAGILLAAVEGKQSS